MCVIGDTLRSKLFGRQNPVGSEIRLKQFACEVIVITSYSIHYTKLYEPAPGDQIAGDKAGNQIATAEDESCSQPLPSHGPTRDNWIKPSSHLPDALLSSSPSGLPDSHRLFTTTRFIRSIAECFVMVQLLAPMPASI